MVDELIEEGVAPIGDAPPAPATSSWLETLPEHMRQDATLQRFSSVEALAGSYLSARQLVGADTLKMPKEEQDWSDVYDKLGRPESPDAYDLQLGPDADVSDIKPLLEAMHSLGLNQKQAQGLLGKLNEIGTQADELETAAQAQARKDAETTLEIDWGGRFDRNAAISKRALREYADPDTVAFLEESGLGNDPRMLKLFHKIGEGMMEDGKILGDGVGVVTQAQAAAKIDELMSHPDYVNPKSTNRANIVRQIQEMYEIKFGTAPSNQNLIGSM